MIFQPLMFHSFCLSHIITKRSVDYSRMGEEYSALDISSAGDQSKKPPHLQCLLLELELGLVAVSMCSGVDCMVIAIAAPNAPLGNVKARLQAITEYVQEALSPLATGEMVASTYG